MMVDGIKVIALLVVVFGGLTVVVVFIRKSRANGFPTFESTSQLAQMKGAMPPTPKPDHWDENLPDEPEA
ncbi:MULTISPECIES: hypothetical protein [unclassified Mycolicibacterium]|uniref:hypothetical protein n=1 Tax=unclassified Mycolicibacterium TaxID=2636767 RepID=UPI0012DC8083|nr:MULTISPECIES: hypothetical protein [unclassified Mycolicibacterium]MUL84974.1 hypothetical protein [Mycolicibacterium sp. CBMA 329]MUL90941.1 hypothetical protein [Mycolicibacterium sp. CBMA 331]MUL98388.1 hypothetical protein [Mycolicibacterium sp. CBMA 334]MUM28560.1 hypothetical protein [Mycolicibacterium sp. CBMA 295]MUM40700.1 hypothetical protein [Mycolicibacterium sp. CBMA 247]